MILSLAIAALLISIAYYIFGADAKPDLPRVGKPGPIGYISTALRYAVNTEGVLREGWEQFSGKPFMVPTLGGFLVILGPQHIEVLRKSNDTVFNQPIAVNEGLQLDHTMNEKQQRNPYQAIVTRTDITRAIASFVPEILEETELAMQDTFELSKNSNSQEPIRIPVFHTLTHMVGRVSNRAMLGTELCRNDEFVHAVVNFAETLIMYARVLEWLPRLLRPVVYFILSSIFGGQKEPKKFIIPYLKQHLHYRENTLETPNNISQFLIRSSGQENVEDLAIRVLNLNFGSIHTSSIFLTNALFELALLPESDLESIRIEVMEVLDMEGGWSKAAIARFRMIDSLLREVGRVHGLGLVAMNRLVIRDGELEDGTPIPAGYTVGLYLKPIHFNPDIYPNPDVFDAFRFSKLRKEEDSDVKHGFTTVDNNYLPFAAGRHACPGRFFAAMELKIMIAYLLLNYDFSLPPGFTERPKNIIFHGSNIPDGKVELMFKRRPEGPGRYI